MTRGYMSPLSTFTLESLVAFRQWSAEQRSGRKKTSASKTNPKKADTKGVKSSE
jgi:hypothetical protein